MPYFESMAYLFRSCFIHRCFYSLLMQDVWRLNDVLTSPPNFGVQVSGPCKGQTQEKEKQLLWTMYAAMKTGP